MHKSLFAAIHCTYHFRQGSSSSSIVKKDIFFFHKMNRANGNNQENWKNLLIKRRRYIYYGCLRKKRGKRTCAVMVCCRLIGFAYLLVLLISSTNLTQLTVKMQQMTMFHIYLQVRSTSAWTIQFGRQCMRNKKPAFTPLCLPFAMVYVFAPNVLNNLPLIIAHFVCIHRN